MEEYAVIKTNKGNMVVSSRDGIQNETIKGLSDIISKKYPGAKFVGIRQISRKVAERIIDKFK